MARHTPHVRAAVLAVALLAALALPARASLIEALDLPGLTARSSRILVGEILSTTSAWDAERRRIYTTVEVQVAELWKGPMPAGGRLRFTQLGGVVGDLEMIVHGLPAFRTGERSVLFLGGDGAGAYLVGLGQGRRPLRFDPPTRRWMVEPGDRSAAVAPVRGPVQPGGARRSFEHVAAEPAIPLDDLRRQVRALVR